MIFPVDETYLSRWPFPSGYHLEGGEASGLHERWRCDGAARATGCWWNKEKRARDGMRLVGIYLNQPLQEAIKEEGYWSERKRTSGEEVNEVARVEEAESEEIEETVGDPSWVSVLSRTRARFSPPGNRDRRVTWRARLVDRYVTR